MKVNRKTEIDVRRQVISEKLVVPGVAIPAISKAGTPHHTHFKHKASRESHAGKAGKIAQRILHLKPKVR